MKPWYASKTLWVNLIALAAALSGAMGLDLGLDTEAQASIVAGIMAIVNIALRLVTKDAVTIGKPPAAALLVGLILAASAGGLAGCAGSQQTKAVTTVAIACDSYATALADAGKLRVAGKLSAGQVDTINKLNRATDAICLPDSPIDPAAATAVVQSAIATIKEIVK